MLLIFKSFLRKGAANFLKFFAHLATAFHTCKKRAKRLKQSKIFQKTRVVFLDNPGEIAVGYNEAMAASTVHFAKLPVS